MTDWKALAEAKGLDIPAEQFDRIVPVLEALEKGFQPLREKVPMATDSPLIFRPLPD
jgi:hypothetical protein